MAQCSRCHHECSDEDLYPVITNLVDRTAESDDIVYMCLPCMHEYYEESEE